MNRILGGIICLSVMMCSVLGCSKPAVEHSVIAEEVKTIEHWKIVPVLSVDTTSDTLARLDLFEKSKYESQEVVTSYVKEVKSQLRNQFGYEFYENFPGVGTIRIELRGEKKPNWMVPSTGTLLDAHERLAREEADDREQAPDGRYPKGVSSGYDDVDAMAVARSRWDRVRAARLVIYDYNDVELGTVTITADADQNIKPGFVASVINRILTRGEY